MQNGATYEFLSQLLNKIIITCTHAHIPTHAVCGTVANGRGCVEHIHRDILEEYTNVNVPSFVSTAAFVVVVVTIIIIFVVFVCCCCSSCCRHHHRTNRSENGVRVKRRNCIQACLSRSILNTHSEKLKQENFCPNNTKPNVRNSCGPQS